MTSHLYVYQRTEKTEDNPFGFVEREQIPADEVCVVYLGGDATEKEKDANGYAKIIKNEILAPMNIDMPVYSVRYDFGDANKDYMRKSLFKKHGMIMSSKLRARIDENSGPEELNPQYIEDLYHKVIEPRISQNGKKIDAEEAMRRLRKVTFVAHCHGGFMAVKLEELMQQKMAELGYLGKERNQIQQQMTVIAHAPGCPLGVAKSNIISFMSAYDPKIPQPLNYFTNYVNKRIEENNMRYYAEKNKNQENIEKYRCFDLKPSFLSGKMGNMFLVKQRFPFSDEGPADLNPDEHDVVNYQETAQINYGRLLTHFSKTILSNVIKNSLQQDEKFTPLQPLEELILSDDKSMNAKESLAFEKMKANGEALTKEVYDHARKITQAYLAKKRQNG